MDKTKIYIFVMSVFQALKQAAKYQKRNLHIVLF